MKEIRRLRIKFILYNMLIVTVIIGSALSAAHALLQYRFRVQSDAFLAGTAQEDTMGENPLLFSSFSGVRIPHFSISIDQNGTVVLNPGAFSFCSDDGFLRELALLSMSPADETGILEDYHLRYLRTTHPTGSVISFVDTSYTDSLSRSLGDTFLLLAAGIWLAFLVLSCFFSKWAVKPVEESLRSQKQFIADASHELKTPLTIILANARLLQERFGGHAPDSDRWLQNIRQESCEMRDLTENLLTLARNELSPGRTAVLSPCSLSDLASESVLTMEPVFYQEEKALDSFIDPDISIKGEPAQLVRLIRILLDNALKYSLPGGHTELFLKRQSSRRVVLWVNSPGEEIPPDMRKRIFERFRRGSQSREKGGYGLGLAIARSIADAHGADIGIRYLDGKNCFYVSFRTSDPSEIRSFIRKFPKLPVPRFLR